MSKLEDRIFPRKTIYFSSRTVYFSERTVYICVKDRIYSIKTSYFQFQDFTYIDTQTLSASSVRFLTQGESVGFLIGNFYFVEDFKNSFLVFLSHGKKPTIINDVLETFKLSDF